MAKSSLDSLLEKKEEVVAYRRPKVGQSVQFITNARQPQAAIVVRAYAEKDPNNKDGAMIEYVNLKVFEDRRTSDTPHYQRLRYSAEGLPNHWRYTEDEKS